MNTAKTQIVRQPERNRCLLRPIADDRHDGPAAWIDPVVLGAITISWNNIIIPVRSRPHGHPDERPFPWLTNDLGILGMRCGTKRAQVTQDQGRSQSYDHHPHALASLPHTAQAQLGHPAPFDFAPLLRVSDIKGTRSATSYFAKTGGRSGLAEPRRFGAPRRLQCSALQDHDEDRFSETGPNLNSCPNRQRLLSRPALPASQGIALQQAWKRENLP